MPIPPTVTSALAKPSLPFGPEAPVGEPALRPRASLLVGEVGELAPEADLLRQRLGQPVGQQLAEQGVEMRRAAARAWPPAPSPAGRSGRKSIADLLAVAASRRRFAGSPGRRGRDG